MLAPLFALAMLAQDRPKPYELGSALFAHCQEAIRIFDNPSAEGDLQSATECTAYIGAFADALLITQNTRSCPGIASVATMTRIYIAYMQKNPKLLDHAKAFGVMLALTDAFPCKEK